MTDEIKLEELDVFFDAARRDKGPGEDLFARVLSDASGVQVEMTKTRVQKAPTRLGFLEAIGGWIAVSGLAAACAAGVAIGVSLPTAATALIDGELSVLWEGQDDIGFAGIDAVAFAVDFEVSE